MTDEITRLLAEAGIGFEVVYDGPQEHCAGCAGVVRTAA